MSRISKIILITCFAIWIIATVAGGCAKVSHNGDLDGMWQVMSIRDGETLLQMPSNERFYYNFYLHTCQLSTKDGRSPNMVGNMKVGEGMISLDFPYIKNGEVAEVLVNALKFWGLPADGQAVFHVVSLDSRHLVMQRDTIIVECRKF